MSEQATAYRLVLVTCPDAGSAERIASELVSGRLAACVNILPGITSVYAWQGRLEKDAELLLLIKTRAELFGKIRDAVVRLHPYELPEVVAVALDDGLRGYLEWIDESVDSDSDS